MALEALNLKTPNALTEAHQRLKNIFATQCCKCIANKKISAAQPNSSAVIEFKTLKILDIQDSNTVNKPIEHLICSPCIDQYVKNNIQNAKASELVDHEKISNNNTYRGQASLSFTIHCEICDTQHNASLDLLPANPIEKNNKKKSCCAGGCNIY